MNTETNFEPIGDATYSPEDNKLRIYAFARLDPDTYARMKEAGYSWAPKQQLFVAPAWNPKRYDLAVELCGEVGDELQSVEDRAATRAERFSRYKANRERDAYQAAARVEQLTEGTPLGQPILIGHHSEQAATRIAKKVTRAMETGVEMWSRAAYWKGRIPAVLRHAEYKADAGLRHRRIKGLEADQRKLEKDVKEAGKWLEFWHAPELTPALVVKLTNYDRSPAYDVMRKAGREDGEPTPQQMELAKAAAIAYHERAQRWPQRWLDHISLRLGYEREMLEGQGGPAAEKFPVEVGGRVQVSRERSGQWLTILRVNKAGGKIASVTTTPPPNVTWTKNWKYGIETVTAYEPPQGGEAEAVREAAKAPPLCNYPGEGFEQMTKEDWAKIYKDYKGTATVSAQDGKAEHRVRNWYGAGKLRCVYLTDSKVTNPPPAPVDPLPRNLQFEARDIDAATPEPAPIREAAAVDVFAGMAATLKAGVAVAVADQLYPTPVDVAANMADLACIGAGDRVLEPSAGTGNLLRAAFNLGATVTAVEINAALCSKLEAWGGKEGGTFNRDFLEVQPGELGTFDAVLMNPPFAKAADIAHIHHAEKFLKPGGVLVAICANGPRQRAAFMDRSEHWQDLPAGTFKAAGTMVNAALFVLRG